MNAYVYWAKRSDVFHTRMTCCLRRVGDERQSDLAVLALPKLRAEGKRLCAACERA